MEYFLIFILQAIGIGLSVLQKVKSIDDKYPDFTKSQIWGVFWDEDWTTLLGSGLVLTLNLVTHFIVQTYAPHFEEITIMGVPYIIAALGIALVLGWGGQRLIYKWLGSAEKVLDKKVNDKLGQ